MTHLGTVIRVLIRAALDTDLDGLGEMAGSRDRAEVRLQAARRARRKCSSPWPPIAWWEW